MNKEVRQSRTILLEYMLLGAVLCKNGDKALILESLEPKDMTASTGRALLESIKDSDRTRFAKVMQRRYGVLMNEDERSIEAILREVKLRQATEAIRGMANIVLETVNTSDRIGDHLEAWEEAIELIRQVVDIENQHRSKCLV